MYLSSNFDRVIYQGLYSKKSKLYESLSYCATMEALFSQFDQNVGSRKVKFNLGNGVL